MKDTGVYPI